jgi:hypothetical protein
MAGQWLASERASRIVRDRKGAANARNHHDAYAPSHWKTLEAGTGIEPVYTDLQSAA